MAAGFFSSAAAPGDETKIAIPFFVPPVPGPRGTKTKIVIPFFVSPWPPQHGIHNDDEIKDDIDYVVKTKHEGEEEDVEKGGDEDDFFAAVGNAHRVRQRAPAVATPKGSL